MRVTRGELETARQNILSRRQAVLTAGGPHAQELARALWADALCLEHAILRSMS